MTHIARVAGLLAVVVSSVAAPVMLAAQAAAAAAPAVAWARITYLSGQSAYIEAGTKDGIREGTRFEVVRGGATVGGLVAEFVSSSRASCKVDSASQTLVIGDSVRYAPARAESRAAGIGAMASATRTRRSSATALRGRIGLRYLVLDPGFGVPLTQPALDLRLDGQHLGESPFGVAVDIRAQRSSSSSTSSLATGNVTRVYQAALILNPLNSPTRLVVGRQFAAALSSVGLFDGAAIDFDRPRWSIGAFGGYAPDEFTFGLSNRTREYGAYVALHNRPAQSPLWSLTLGGVGAYSLGQIDREFAFVRATYNDRHLSVYATQELDINRDWKSTTEGSATTPTASFVTVLLSVTDALSLSAGVDNRRSVRLYRDYLTPEITFDDSFRQGEWGGAMLNFGGHVRLSADARASSGGSTGKTQSVTGSFSLYRLTPLQVGLHVRATTFTGTLSEGRLQSASLEINPFSFLRFEFSGGTRDSSLPLDAASTTHLTWTGIDADLGIGRSVYLMLSTYKETGTNDHSLQTFASLSYRF